jgi:hypothetical protein
MIWLILVMLIDMLIAAHPFDVVIRPEAWVIVLLCSRRVMRTRRQPH